MHSWEILKWKLRTSKFCWTRRLWRPASLGCIIRCWTGGNPVQSTWTSLAVCNFWTTSDLNGVTFIVNECFGRSCSSWMSTEWEYLSLDALEQEMRKGLVAFRKEKPPVYGWIARSNTQYPAFYFAEWAEFNAARHNKVYWNQGSDRKQWNGGDGRNETTENG